MNEIINISEALDRVMGNKEMYKRWLGNFFVPTTMEGAISAFEQQDYEAAHFALHKLKGTAANLSINTFAELTIALDAKIKEKIPFGQLTDEFEAVKNEYKKAEDFFKNNPQLFD